MKLLHITTYPARGQKHGFAGGVSSYSKNLITSISRQEHKGEMPETFKVHKVFVLCNKINGQHESYEEDEMQVIRCFDKKQKYFFQLLKEIKQINPDVIHIQQELALFGNVFTAYLLQWLLFLLRNKKVIITLHGVVSIKSVNKSFIRDNYKKLPPFLARLGLYIIFKPLCIWSKKVIVHEPYFKEILENEYHVPANKIEVVTHGVEDLHPIPSEEAKKQLNVLDKDVILSMGYLTGYKGIDLLINGFALYAKANPNAYLFIGAGLHPKLKDTLWYKHEYARLQKKAESLIPSDQYRWVGFIEEKDIPSYLGASDVSVYPYTISMSSSGPMAMAMGAEKPFLVSSVFADIFPNKEMIFEQTPEAMSQCLTSFFENPAKLNLYIKILKQERLWKKIGEETVRTYTNLVKDKKKKDAGQASMTSVIPTCSESFPNSDINKKKKNVLLLGSYGQTNLGDEALLHSYLSFFQNSQTINTIYANVSRIALIHPETKKLFPRLVLFETYQTSIRTWYKLIKKSDMIVFGGGTIIKELYRSTGRSKHAVTLRMLAFLLLAKGKKKQVWGLNIGIGNIHSSLGKWIAKNILKRMDYVSVRDKKSYDSVFSLLPKKYQHNLSLTTDGIFLCPPSQNFISIKTGIYTNIDSPMELKVTIGINCLHDIPNAISEQFYYSTLASFYDFLIAQEKAHLIFLPFQTDYNKNNDLSFFCTSILPLMQQKNGVTIADDLNVTNISTWYHQIDFLIGMRLHSLIYGILFTKPFLSINYADKCSYLTTDMQYPHTLEWNNFNIDNLISNWYKLRSSKEEALFLLQTHSEKLKKEGQKEILYLSDLL